MAEKIHKENVTHIHAALDNIEAEAVTGDNIGQHYGRTHIEAINVTEDWELPYSLGP